MTDHAALTIREATPADAAQILAFITDLAIYERAEDKVLASEDDIRDHLFCEHPHAHALMLEAGEENASVGYAIYFLNFSTWLGRHGLFLEDVYVAPAARGRGYAGQLMRHLACLAVDKGYARFEWNVLDWNAPAISFYETLGAAPQSEWIGYRLEGDALASLAAERK